MIDKLGHYSLENPASIYDEEAMTALQLAARIAAKVNESVEAFNELEADTNKRLNQQDITIDERMTAQDEHIPVEVDKQIDEHINEGDFDEEISRYLGDLRVRLDELSRLEEGSTTGDAELADIRVGYDGNTDTGAGVATRRQFNKVISTIGETISNIEKGSLTITPALVDGYVSGAGGISDNGNNGYYKRTNYIEIPLFCTGFTSTFKENISCCALLFNANKQKIIALVPQNFVGGGALGTLESLGAKYVMFSNYASDGKTHGTPSVTFTFDTGNSIYNLSQVKTYLDTISTSLSHFGDSYTENNINLVDGFVRYANGTLSDDSNNGFYKRSDYIVIPRGTKKIISNFIFADGQADGYAFYDINKKFISGGKTATISSVPEKAFYIALTDYNSTGNGAHAAKYATFVINTVKSSTAINTLASFGDSHVARGMWQNAVISRLGITKHVNLGMGSSPLSVTTEYEATPCCDDSRINYIITNNVDTVVMICGTNDVHNGCTLGDASQLTATTKNRRTIYGAYSYIIEKLLDWKPTLNIVICTLPQAAYDAGKSPNYADVSKAIKEIGEYYGVTVADLYGKCGINKKNLSSFSDDDIHYNQAGYDRVAEVIINAIEDSYI